MWFKHKAWIPVAWVASVANLGAVWFAAVPGEPAHATLHALLAVGFGLGARHLAVRQRLAEQHEALQDTLDQNEQLQQALEDMQSGLRELEERVDFSERLLAQHRDAAREGAPPPGT